MKNLYKLCLFFLLFSVFIVAQEEGVTEPSEEKIVESTEEKPSESTEEKPSESTEEKPSESTEEKPSESTEEKPSESTEEKVVVIKNYGLPDEVWEKCQYTCNEEKILDMTTDYWCELSPADQAKYAKIYQEGYAKTKKLEVEINITAAEASFAMRLVPPGKFWIGSEDKEKGRNHYNEYSCRIIISKPYYICKYEITQGQWKAAMGENPSFFQSLGDNNPVEQVTWEEHCKSFCEKIEMQLPTEAQWEYACRSGVYGMSYVGDFILEGKNNAPKLDTIAWYAGNSGLEEVSESERVDSSDWPEKQYPHVKAGTHPVGQKESNAWGIYDMQGNVWEWCHDFCDYSAGSVKTKTYKNDIVDPKSEDSNMMRRIYRGGSWYSSPLACRAAIRNGDSPTYKSNKLGLRCVKDCDAIAEKKEESNEEEKQEEKEKEE